MLFFVGSGWNPPFLSKLSFYVGTISHVIFHMSHRELPSHIRYHKYDSGKISVEVKRQLIFQLIFIAGVF